MRNWYHWCLVLVSLLDPGWRKLWCLFFLKDTNPIMWPPPSATSSKPNYHYPKPLPSHAITLEVKTTYECMARGQRQTLVCNKLLWGKQSGSYTKVKHRVFTHIDTTMPLPKSSQENAKHCNTACARMLTAALSITGQEVETADPHQWMNR